MILSMDIFSPDRILDDIESPYDILGMFDNEHSKYSLNKNSETILV